MTNIIYSSSLQAPISLANPTGSLTLASDPSASIHQQSPIPHEGVVSLLGSSVRLALAIATLAGVVSFATAAPRVTPGTATVITPAAGAVSLAGAVPTVSVNVAPINWQLAAGHYVPSQFAPVLIYPRPDSETNSWERHRLCPAGTAWSFPVGLLYGAWPFQYSLSGAPAGMTIGTTFGSPGYGVMSWANPVAGTYTITAIVTTQDFGRTAGSADPTGQYSVTFTLEVAAATDARFVWANAATGSDSNGGTSAAPWKTLAGFSSAPTSGKQFWLRAGTYAMTALSSVLDLTSKAKVFVGYPGETVKIDYSQSWSHGNISIQFNGGNGTSGGCSASNIYFFGSPSNWAGGSSDMYHILHNGDRGVYYNNIFDSMNGLGAGDSNFGNWSGIAMFAFAGMHNYVGCCDSTFKNFTRLNTGGGMVWYSSRYGIMERNTITGFTSPGNVMHGFISKGHCSRTSIRANMADTTNNFSSGPYYQPQGSDGGEGDAPNFNETCWNWGFQAPLGNNGVSPGAQIYGPSSYAAWSGAVFRNTIIGPNWMSASTASTLNCQGNVVCSEHGTLNDADHYSQTGPLTISNSSTNVIDIYTNRANVVNTTNGYLLPAYAASKGITIGTVGHQVA